MGFYNYHTLHCNQFFIETVLRVLLQEQLLVLISGSMCDEKSSSSVQDISYSIRHNKPGIVMECLSEFSRFYLCAQIWVCLLTEQIELTMTQVHKYWAYSADKYYYHSTVCSDKHLHLSCVDHYVSISVLSNLPHKYVQCLFICGHIY